MRNLQKLIHSNKAYVKLKQILSSSAVVCHLQSKAGDKINVFAQH